MRIRCSYEGKEQLFESEQSAVLIGRSDERLGVSVDLDLTPDRTVSRLHAKLSVDEKGQYWIEDLGSKHGTLVNGVDIKGKGKVMLAPGVKVGMGNTTLMLVAEEQAEAEKGRKGEGERKGQPLVRQRLRVKLRCLPTVNYSLVHLELPVLSEVEVFNDADSAVTNLSLQFSLGTYASLAQPIDISSVAARGRCRIAGRKIPQFQFDRDKLAGLREARTVALQAGANGEAVPLDPPTEVKLLPPNAWYWPRHHQTLAGFVMPGSRAVSQVICGARPPLRRLMRTESFADALDSPHPDRVERMIQAIYFCLNEQYAIAYEREPRTYDPDWQMVRFHHEVLDELRGTCIDLALLLAACLEHVHLDPMIVIVRTAPTVQHALVACWREASPLGQALICEGNRIQRWVRSGELLLLDSVGYARGEYADLSFADCRRSGESHLDKACARDGAYQFEYAVDILGARRQKVMSLPFGEGVEFDKRAGFAVFQARELAETLKRPALTARHLFLGLLGLEDGLLRRLFAQLKKDVEEIVEVTRNSLESVEQPPRVLRESEDWKAIMRSLQDRVGTRLVKEADLAIALLQTRSQVDKVLDHFGLNPQQCLDALQEVTEGWSVPSTWRSSGFA
jgi:pSer/pThr/pTyr-binding forkhead associated (FHA) protein